MAYDKVVDSTQLDSDLTSVADAIRAKSGGSAQLAFPSGFVSEIGNIPSGGGDPYEQLRLVLANQATSIDIDMQGKSVAGNRTFGISALKHLKMTNVGTSMSNNLAAGSSLIDFVCMFKTTGPIASNCVAKNTLLVTDTNASQLNGYAFSDCSNMATLILRRTTIVTCQNTNVFNNSPFALGKAGGTIYIPKVLYDHLGDGSALDYQSATNWATYYGYGTITWAKIEGSIYETQYGDGSSIA